MMKHVNEEELILYSDGELKNRQKIAAHLNECAECRQELARIESVFADLHAMAIPDPGEDYEQRLWRQLTPRMAEKSAHWWVGLFAPRRLLAAGVLATMIVLAFVAGRITNRPQPAERTMDAGKVRERVLVVAVREHLGRSEMVLMELENASPALKGQKSVDISATQRRAENLLEENRLYRQTALRQGDQNMASTLDELERVLLDISNSPDSVTLAQFESLRKRIEDRGILFKVRVVNQDLQERSKPAKPKPASNDSAKKERNKA